METIITVQGLRKVYAVGNEKVVALDNINLEIGKGQICCILGTSGSGKSTFLNQLAGLEKPTRGSVLIGKHNISKFGENQLAKFRQKYIGFIFQSYNLMTANTALENVAMPLMFRGVGKTERNRKAAAMLREVGLGDRLHHRPNQMSGGQQQRVGIARAFVARPAIIFADEPTGNLDTKTTVEVMEMMVRMSRENNQTFILVTHDQYLSQYADRIVTLIDGNIVSDVENVSIVDRLTVEEIAEDYRKKKEAEAPVGQEASAEAGGSAEAAVEPESAQAAEAGVETPVEAAAEVEDEAPGDAGVEAAVAEPVAEAGVEAPVEAVAEAQVEVGVGAPGEAGAEAVVVEPVAEAGVEAPVEAVAEAQVEVGVETAVEPVVEAVVDASIEAVAEVEAEAVMEAATEVVEEAAEEVEAETAVEPVVEAVVDALIEAVAEVEAEAVMEAVVEPETATTAPEAEVAVFECSVTGVVSRGPAVEPSIEPGEHGAGAAVEPSMEAGADAEVAEPGAGAAVEREPAVEPSIESGASSAVDAVLEAEARERGLPGEEIPGEPIVR